MEEEGLERVGLERVVWVMGREVGQARVRVMRVPVVGVLCPSRCRLEEWGVEWGAKE